MDDCSDPKVSAHTDKAVIGFGVEADEDECKSEDVNDTDDIDEAIDADVVNNHFFDRCVHADTVTNDNDFSNNGRRMSRTVFCSSSTFEKKCRVIPIIKGWSCDKCTYQHRYPAQFCAFSSYRHLFGRLVAAECAILTTNMLLPSTIRSLHLEVITFPGRGIVCNTTTTMNFPTHY